MWWRRPPMPMVGSVLHPGGMAPRADEYEYLRELSFDVKAAPAHAEMHWRVRFTHPQLGQGELAAFRHRTIDPSMYARYAWGDAENEADNLRRAGVDVTVRLEGDGSNVLRQRKRLLRVLDAMMQRDGLAAFDHQSYRLWSAASLQEELSHDADLDVMHLFCLHAVCEEGETDCWAHTHGLKEVGGCDVHVLGANRELLGSPNGIEALRAIAFAVLERKAVPNGAAVDVLGPQNNFVLLPMSEFAKRCSRSHARFVEGLDELHTEGCAMVCRPRPRGLRALFAGPPRPSDVFSRPQLPDDTPLCFSDSATELSAERARLSIPLLRSLLVEFADLRVEPIAKLFLGRGASREHMWFRVHGWGDTDVDVELLSTPFGDLGIQPGDRRRLGLETMTDWALMTPAGMITPRALNLARTLRQHRAEIRAHLARHERQ